MAVRYTVHQVIAAVFTAGKQAEDFHLEISNMGETEEAGIMLLAEGNSEIWHPW